MTGVDETPSGAVGGVSLTVAVGKASVAIAGRGASLAVTGGTERLAVAVGGGTPSVADGGQTLVVADAAELLAVAIGGQTLLMVAGGAEPLSVNGGGASESGGESEVWHLALSCNQKLTDKKPRANSAAFFIRILQTTSTWNHWSRDPFGHKISITHMAIKVDGNEE
jgi:hypothetical protein